MGCTYVKEFSFGGKVGKDSKPAMSKGKVTEKATGEVYASKKAMAKHEKAESPAKQKAEEKGNKFAMGGIVPPNRPAMPPPQMPPQGIPQRPMMPQRGVPVGGLTKFARGGGVPATSKEPLIVAVKIGKRK